jgi:predicted N-acetyltransferase YhbS
MNFVRIRFNDSDMETLALGYLAGRFSFRTWETGETLVPEAALAALTKKGYSYIVLGPPTYAQTVPPALRTSSADQLQ